MSDKKNRGQWQLYLMLAIMLGVIIAGFVIFPKTAEQREALLQKIGTTNHGELLVTPAEIQSLTLTTMQNQPWVFSEQKVKWRMLLIGDEICSDQCLELLYTTRQVHLRLGKNAHRLERIYLTGANQLSENLASTIAKEHPYLIVLKTDPAQLDDWLRKLVVPGQSIVLLVDQNGLAMMLYSDAHDGGDILEDINHLLKYSPDQ